MDKIIYQLSIDGATFTRPMAGTDEQLHDILNRFGLSPDISSDAAASVSLYLANEKYYDDTWGNFRIVAWLPKS